MYTSHEIVQRINARLKEIGMSKTDFSEKSGVSSASLSQWNKGQRFPTQKSLKRIAECLGMSIEELVAGNPIVAPETKTQKPPQDELAGLRDDQKELVELIRGFNSRQCREVYNLIEAAMKLSDNK